MIARENLSLRSRTTPNSAFATAVSVSLAPVKSEAGFRDVIITHYWCALYLPLAPSAACGCEIFCVRITNDSIQWGWRRLVVREKLPVNHV